MCCMKMASCISYASGQPRKLGVSAWHERNEKKWKMVVKGISRKIFRRIALESGPTVHLGG